MDPKVKFAATLLLATSVSIVLLGVDSVHSGGIVRGYLLWNLFLAWVPFGLSIWLHLVLQRKLWSSWEALLVTGAWLAFLPNAFYMISDFIHLTEAPEADLLFAVVMFTAFVYTSVALGLASVYLVHSDLRRRISGHGAAIIIGLVLLACSFAVYIGRDLRWNSWDVLVNPPGVLFDVSERLLHPSQYPPMLVLVLPLFILLLSMYALAWVAVRDVGTSTGGHR